MAKEQAGQDSPVTPDSSPHDLASLGEAEFTEKSGSERAASPDSGPGASPDSPKKDTQDADATTQGGDQPSPNDEDEDQPQPDRVQVFLDEMAALKQKSEQEGSDEYSQRLKAIEDEDPVKARLWKTEARVSGLRKGYQEQRTARRQLEPEASRLKAAQAQAKLDGFKELTEDEIEDLDKEEYATYILQKSKIAEAREESAKSGVTQAQLEQVGEYEDFLYAQFGVEVSYDEQGKITPESTAKMEAALPQETLNAVDAKLEELFGSGKVYTAQQIAVTYEHVNRDKILAAERMRARTQVVESQERAKHGQSRLGDLPASPGGRRSERQRRNIADISTEEMAAMGEEEFEALRAQN